MLKDKEEEKYNKFVKAYFENNFNELVDNFIKDRNNSDNILLILNSNDEFNEWKASLNKEPVVGYAKEFVSDSNNMELLKDSVVEHIEFDKWYTKYIDDKWEKEIY